LAVYGSFENDDLLKKSKNQHLLPKNDEKQKSPGHHKIAPEMK